MPLVEFRDGSRVQYVFAGEEFRLPPGKWRGMPPNPATIHSTAHWMSEDPGLDSFETLSDLSEQLTLEAAQEREEKVFQKYLIEES